MSMVMHTFGLMYSHQGKIPLVRHISVGKICQQDTMKHCLCSIYGTRLVLVASTSLIGHQFCPISQQLFATHLDMSASEVVGIHTCLKSTISRKSNASWKPIGCSSPYKYKNNIRLRISLKNMCNDLRSCFRTQFKAYTHYINNIAQMHNSYCSFFMHICFFQFTYEWFYDAQNNYSSRFRTLIELSHSALVTVIVRKILKWVWKLQD